MSTTTMLPTGGLKKLQIKETVLFAINNIPDVDQATLEKFLESVNATGTFGSMSHEQIVTKMRLTLKYIPNACPHSFLILADLLEIPPPLPLPSHPLSLPTAHNGSQAGFITPGATETRTSPNQIRIRQSVSD